MSRRQRAARRRRVVETLEPRLLLSSVVPTGWTDADIGAPGQAGSANFTASSGGGTIAGGGADIYNTSDQFNFASETISGNGTAIVKVNSVGNTDPWAKSGLMFRGSSAVGDMFADMVITPGQGVSFQWRSAINGPSNLAQTTGIVAPQWLELVRSGTAASSTFTGSYSTDGNTWIQVGTTTISSFASSALVGLAVTAHNNSALSTSTFSNLSVSNSPPTVATAAAASPNPPTGPTTTLSVLGADIGGESNLTYTWITTGAPPAPVTFSANGTNAAKSTTATFTIAGTYSFQVTIADPSGLSTTSTLTVHVPSASLPSGWSDSDIGTPGVAGFASFSSGNWTVAGGGADIWNTADQFNFTSESFSGDSIVTARVTSVSNSDPWAKAGVMVRSSTAAGSQFADVVVTPGNGVAFQWRTSTGGGCATEQVSAIVAPQWVKLERVGSDFYGFYSADGSTWTQIGSLATISMPTATVAGLAVTAHNNTLRSTATFTNLTINPNTAPTVATAASANPTPVSGYTTNLSVLGADDGGEGNLTYTWAATGTPPAPVTFSVNGTNAAKNTVVSMTLSGSYTFAVTITDLGGLTTTSSVTISASVPPLPPIGVSPYWNGNNIALSWLTTARAQSYSVYRATSPSGEGATPIASSLASTTYTDTTVTSGQTYYYQITATDSGGLESGRSFEAVAQTAPPTTPIISEFEALNSSGIKDEDGSHSDWIELFNPTPSDINLNGYYLTDKPANLTEWQIPTVTLPSGGFLIIFADSKNRTDPNHPLHTNFGLSGAGEYVALVAPDGVSVLSSYAFPQQLSDVAYGIGLSEATTSLIGPGATAHTLVPTDGSLGTTWVQPGFNDSTWQSGTTGVGYETETAVPTSPGFAVQMIDTQGGTDGSLSDISKATALLNGTSPPGAFTIVFNGTASRPLINLGDGGNYSGDLTLPNGLGGSAADNGEPGRTDYALRVTSYVVIPAGQYTIDANSDDGFRLRIPGITFTNRVNENFTGATNPSPADTLVYGGQRGASDTLGTFTVPAGGLTTTINLDYYEHGGGDELELAIASGLQTAFSSTTFSLLGNGVLGWQVLDPSGPTTPNYASLIGTNTQSQMYNTGNNAAYIRVPFTASNPASLTNLRFGIKYDDGFVAYVNGQQIAARNAPSPVAWNSSASATHADTAALNYETISIPSSVLVAGTNVLAIEGLNAANDQSDFLIYPILDNLIVSFGAQGYLPPTPGAANGQAIAQGIAAEPTFDHPDGFYNQSFPLAISTSTPGAQIRYTVDGTVPTPTTGFLYSGPITISGETDIRAVAFAPGDLPSAANTSTYIFVNDVIQQSSNGLPPPGWPSNWGRSVEHYGMDPRVVTDPQYSGEIKQDLLDIPTFSLTMNLADLFDPNTGIYANSGLSGSAWERPASIELINPSGTPGFQANVGVRIHGGYSSVAPDAKHGFRIMFSSKYGPSQLNYPLFGPGAAQTFKEFDLRTDQNNSWQYDSPSAFIGIRDEFSSGALLSMGQPAEHTYLCFLYINGVFWGLFATMERPDADFAASYYGGTAANYDVIKSGGYDTNWTLEATDGTMGSWTQLFTNMSTLDMSNNANYELIQGNNPDGTRNPSYPDLLDVNNLIDYMLLIYYTGNLDAPNSNFLSNLRPNNFYAIRPQDGSFGFRFVATDSEWTLLDVNQNRVNTAVTPTLLTSNPAWFFQQLEANPNFRMLVADHIQKQFFDNGPFSVQNATARFTALENQIYGPTVPESARWGDVLRPSQPYTRNVEWQAEINRIQSQYLPQRTAIVLTQLEAVGLFPNVAAPSYSQFGGTIPSGYQLTITNPNNTGTIYYTTDGSDPMATGGGVSATALAYAGPIVLSLTTEVKARVFSGTTWSALEDATFALGASSVRITEFNYDPAKPPTGSAYNNDDFEFVELKNFSSQTVNLKNIAFTDGINYTFGNVTLGPWQAGVVVKNFGAFQSRYGTSIYVLGSYESTGQNFSNSGEHVALVDASGQTLANFTYSPTWYPTTHGGGYAMEVINPTSNPDLNNPASWQAGTVLNGTPGIAGSSLNLAGSSITINLDGDEQYLDTSVDGTFTQYLIDQIGSITVTGTSASNVFSVGENSGTIPSLSYVGGSGANILTILGGSGNDVVSIDGANSLVSYDGTTLSLSKVSSVAYADSGGNDMISLSGPTPATINASTGNDSITINDTSGVTLNPGTGSISLALNAGITTIPASTLTGIRQVNFTNLGIAAGAKLVLAQSSATNNDYSKHGNRTVANIAAGGLNIVSGGTLDMGDNDLILHYAPANETAANSQVRGLLAAGFDGASWDTAGINSSTANYDANFGAGTRTLGYADNNDLGYSTFDGVDTSDGNEVLVKFTYYGDSDLNGKINGTDFSLFGAGRSRAGTGWDFGDYDYSGGRPNGTDFSLFGAGLSSYRQFGTL